MGQSCARRLGGRRGPETLDDDGWGLIGEVVDPVLAVPRQRVAKQWAWAILRVQLVLRFRRRWSFYGAWLNVSKGHWAYTAVASRRARVANRLKLLRSAALTEHLIRVSGRLQDR